MKRPRRHLAKTARRKTAAVTSRVPAKSAAPQAKSARKSSQGFGTRLLSQAERSRAEQAACTGNVVAAGWARFRLWTDDSRRHAAVARATGQDPRTGKATKQAKSKSGKARVRVTHRGVEGPGGGLSRSVGRHPEFRATTAQVAGLWPWCVGAGAPVIGTPLGRHLDSGEPVCFDPMNWFSRGRFITAPSLFVLGLNGFGKSSLVRRIVLGGIAQGITPLVLADVKPDYRDTIAMCGGQVIDLGYGHGRINPLDPGVMGNALARLRAGGHTAAAASLDAEIRARHTTLVAGLVELVRGERIRDFEDTLISTALRILFTPSTEGGRGHTIDAPPILDDLAEVIAAGGAELMLDAAAANPDQYQAAIIDLRRSLRALTQGPFGTVFNGPTTVPIDVDSVGVCIDVSHIPKGDKKLKAAAMLVCWSAGFGAVEALNLLAELGLEKQRYFQVVMDELWQVLGLGEFMIARVDELTRLQRSLGVALIMISHSIRDLQALGASKDRAVGFLERARAKILGPLPADELAALDGTVKLTGEETAMVTSWSAPQALTGEPIRAGQAPPIAAGVGKFLLKVSEDRSPGIPFLMELTDIERESGIHDTSAIFSSFGDPAGADGRLAS
ncbi:hypothetical protein JK358_37325 [Nocardia sp. 2]|uniref:ATP/GTP-binding protein n=1 Tax=Nocardia acididurans TaxID=2802282 RepID=A0ABS1MID1_9NOCA|nr:hypothetical protein [Nocardia acididurans]MBL1080074.1 hypothetical protein [Nocardia acididurans]